MISALFISVMMINYTSKNVCIGSAITKRIRHTGVLAVKVYTKKDIGSGEAYSYADQIRGLMDNLNQDNLLTMASMTRKNDVPDDGWEGNVGVVTSLLPKVKINAGKATAFVLSGGRDDKTGVVTGLIVIGVIVFGGLGVLYLIQRRRRGY